VYANPILSPPSKTPPFCCRSCCSTSWIFGRQWALVWRRGEGWDPRGGGGYRPRAAPFPGSGQAPCRSAVAAAEGGPVRRASDRPAWAFGWRAGVLLRGGIQLVWAARGWAGRLKRRRAAPAGFSTCERERFTSSIHASLWVHSSHIKLVGRGIAGCCSPFLWVQNSSLW